MIVGHYAAALIPYGRLKEEGHPFWLLLLCANIPEFLWLVLAFAGVEEPVPASVLDATFQNLQVQMIYSHNLLPVLVQSVVTGSVVWLVTRHHVLSAWCAFLCLLHGLCDMLVGFEHQWLQPDSPVISLNTYGRVPHLAVLMELAFALACVAWYVREETRRQRPPSRRRVIRLAVVFAAGILVWLPAATLPLRTLLPH